MFNHMVLCLKSISLPTLFDLISSSNTTQYNYFLSGDLTKLILIPFYLLLFNYLYSDVLNFTFRVEDGERRSQRYSGEHDWLGPYLTQNT